MRRLGIVLLLAFPLTASAWTRASDERIAKKSAALAPPDLRLVIERFEADYKRGLERAQAEEATDSHQFFVLSREGRLRERIERETRSTVAAIRKGDPMSASSAPARTAAARTSSRAPASRLRPASPGRSRG